MNEIMIGADPEIFLKRGDQFISAIGKVGGSKIKPRKLPGGYAVQEDNVAVEYNIPACKNAAEFVRHNTYMLGYLSHLAETHGCELAPGVASAVFSDEELDHPMAHVFGCEPDYNGWTLEVNPKPNAQNPNLRSCGGHIHIGVNAENMMKIKIIRVLDATIGMILRAMEPENERAQLYGRPGALRFKDYGVEWRTPSNYWLSNPEVMSATVEYIPMIVDDVRRGRLSILTNDWADKKIHAAFDNKSVDMDVIQAAADRMRYFPNSLLQLYLNKSN